MGKQNTWPAFLHQIKARSIVPFLSNAPKGSSHFCHHRCATKDEYVWRFLVRGKGPAPPVWMTIAKAAGRRIQQLVLCGLILPCGAGASSLGEESSSWVAKAEGCTARSITIEDCAQTTPGNGNVKQAEADFEMGQRAILNGNRLAAIAYFSRALGEYPEHLGARLNRGAALIELGRTEEALSDLNQVIRMNANDPDALYNRGCAFMKQGEFFKALDDFSRAIYLDPGKAEAYNERGLVYDRAGQYELALGDYASAIRLKPSSAAAYSNRGFILLRLGRLDEAEASFNRGLVRDHGSAHLLYGLGLARQSRRDYEKAIVLFSAALVRSEELVDLYLSRAECHLILKRFDLAIADYTTFLKHEPRRPAAYEGRGQAYFDKGDATAALTDFRSALTVPARSKADEEAQQRASAFVLRLTH
jgi:tetratricopeptide (TPR) repeat protein